MKMAYLVESVCWLVTAEVVLEPKVQRTYHHLQREKYRGLQVHTFCQCIPTLQLAVNQPLEIVLWNHIGYFTVSASR